MIKSGLEYPIRPGLQRRDSFSTSRIILSASNRTISLKINIMQPSNVYFFILGTSYFLIRVKCTSKWNHITKKPGSFVRNRESGDKEFESVCKSIMDCPWCLTVTVVWVCHMNFSWWPFIEGSLCKYGNYKLNDLNLVIVSFKPAFSLFIRHHNLNFVANFNINTEKYQKCALNIYYLKS